MKRDPLAEYLEDLRQALRCVPAAGRREVMEEIEEHIAAARAELGGETDAGLRTILDRLGEPEDIGAETRERFGVRAGRARWREVAALVLLPFGGLVIPFAGWFVGVFFLWASEAWTRREKLLGTLVLPFGLVLPLGLAIVGGTSSDCSGPVGGPLECTGGGSNAAWTALAVVLLVAPLVSTGYLAARLRRR
jgi:hypothetical protein